MTRARGAAVDPEAAARQLVASRAPYLIGVRHHSPACASAIPALLDALRPTALLVELPPDFEPWIAWLGHRETCAPVALAGGRPGREDLCFYPFADFSPELVALRWAVRRKVPVVAIDLPVASMARAEARLAGERWRPELEAAENGRTLLGELIRRTGADGVEELWDRLVEVRAPGASPEQIRTAALSAGWALRADAALGDGISREDLAREARMRACIAEHARGKRTVAALVGSFHAAALLPEPLLSDGAVHPLDAPEEGVVTSLIPYAFELLDSRSGYPAGIRDPGWQQRVLEALTGKSTLDEVTAEVATAVCRELRERGHVASLPDAQEAVRLARDLATLRGLPAPGRRELLEGIASSLAQGQLLGRGRALASALEAVLCGRTRGELAAGTPRSGLLVHVLRLLEELRLPGPETPLDPRDEEKKLRLDPLRSELDRRRHVTLQRLSACGVPYATLEESDGRGETLTSVWNVAWSPGVEATIELAGTRGVTLAQAAAGALQAAERRLEEAETLTAAARLELCASDAECGLLERVNRGLDALAGPFLDGAGLAELVRAHALCERIDRGHVAGLPRPSAERPSLPVFERPLAPLERELLAACVRSLDGVAGSERIDDARSLLELVHLFERQPAGAEALGPSRLLHSLEAIAREGSPLMQGAAEATLCASGRRSAAALGTTMGSWLDGSVEDEGLRTLAARLRGALTVAGPQIEASPALLGPFADRLESIDDQAFLRRLASLRDGFETLSPAARERLLETIAERIGDPAAARAGELALAPELLALFATADAEGRRALGRLDAELLALGDAPLPGTVAAASAQPRRTGLSPLDRWRLVLGRERERLAGSACRMASALDELYGSGRGEGSQSGVGAGREESFPTAREWSEELEALFGESVREEVLGRAAHAGRGDALYELDPERVTPSVELLEHVLSLQGALPEAHLARLRRLVERCVEELTRALAVRVRPALTGIATPRPSRRRRGPLDLRRTVRANLATVRADGDGAPVLHPEQLYFTTRGRRSIDWRLVLVVDVSGSMEPSTIYSAMMAAILSGIPALAVHFVTFSTEVIDLSERASDPLALLLEIKVGGGTHIAKALRYARELCTVPQRTMLVLVSDFDEGYSTDGLTAEIRHLCDSGVKLLGLAALDDRGKPRYNAGTAAAAVDAGMPVAALTPLELARWVAERMR